MEKTYIEDDSINSNQNCRQSRVVGEVAEQDLNVDDVFLIHKAFELWWI